ncbi:DUF3021 domain-containing protein [Lysinibacillus pakistanensis]|uniref:DUF3021 domain-containing protein n=1 Tax=Lysinibacillus pakistanensis TaxID=759811 RepID=A0AAX3WZB5_9BACI|nr:DUF3021 domain-containing protein [Lysinibacillus pakistanensis]MDM5232566.1 DUF3021 domain-containing protein [Lysinibacillus pakistanensis]QGG50725.1 DUF3021 family protein [Lysinibacillus pakistanensis]WHY48073.1 DUF3021 domain-containing protein [Lysinibacillus pakistanensis]WHY53085.1 DUF3021 domain-containing protein [Lysinibacillus pakistanensis]
MKILRMMIIGLLISLSSSYVLVTLSMLSNNEVIVGSALLEQVIIAAILGVVIGLLSLIYDIERLPFLIQLPLHIIAVTLCVIIAGYFGHWFDHSSLVYILIAEIVIYVIVWGITYVLQLNDIKEINHEIQKRKE